MKYKRRQRPNESLAMSNVDRPKANLVIHCGDASAMCFQIYKPFDQSKNTREINKILKEKKNDNNTQHTQQSNKYRRMKRQHANC